jgi:hypothetical protein
MLSALRRWLVEHQPLAFAALDGSSRPDSIGHETVIPAEAELIDVAVKVIFADVMVGAVDPALEE